MEYRGIVKGLKGQGVSQRRSCELLGIARSSCRYEERPEVEDRTREEIRALAREHKGYGSRILCGLIRQSRVVNHKKVERIYQEEGLQLPRRTKRKRRYGVVDERPYPATRHNDVWSCDFVFDRDVMDQKLKFFTLVDECTRESPAIRVGKRFTAQDVQNALERAIREYGKPRYLRMDNGPEFISQELRQWLLEQGIQPVHTDPGSPWQNGFIESFNGKFRATCLNMELFWGVEEAQWVAEKYRIEYNTLRPHMSLGYRTPAEARRICVSRPSMN